MADEVAKERKKLAIALRAERRLETRLADIDWEYDVLLPELEKFDAAATRGKLPKVKLK
jgi:hypothetical protein